MLMLYKAITSVAAGVLGVLRSNKSDEDSLWADRLGRGSQLGPVDIWLHAASVGEVKIISYLVAQLKQVNPELKLHVTTMTTTGQKTARQLLSNQAGCSFFPYDAPGVIRRTLDRIRPRMVVIAETEIWPNLVNEAHQRRLPVVMVNARMTVAAERRYRWVRRTIGRLLSTYDRFFFKSEADAQRYQSFGIAPERGQVVGDMKFDAPVPRRSEKTRRAVRDRLGAEDSDFLWVAGSTRSGEEALLAGAFQQLISDIPNLKLVLVPRHVERADQVLQQIKTTGLAGCLMGKEKSGIIVVDRMGMLNDLYLAADLAFVGGTLVDIGGHNLLEPVWAGTPVTFGPSIFGVADQAEYIQSHNYGAMAVDGDELARLVRDVIGGIRKFDTKNGTDPADSATVKVARYLLRRLDNV